MKYIFIFFTLYLFLISVYRGELLSINLGHSSRIDLQSCWQALKINIFLTEILMKKVDLQSFFMNEMSKKKYAN